MTIAFPTCFSRRRLFRAAVSAGVVVLAAAVQCRPASAQYDPAKALVEIDAIASQYPDPEVTIDSPAFAAGKTGFTSQQEMLVYIRGLAAQSPSMRVRQLRPSQQWRAIPLLVFAEPAVSSGAELSKNG